MKCHEIVAYCICKIIITFSYGIGILYIMCTYIAQGGSLKAIRGWGARLQEHNMIPIGTRLLREGSPVQGPFGLMYRKHQGRRASWPWVKTNGTTLG